MKIFFQFSFKFNDCIDFVYVTVQKGVQGPGQGLGCFQGNVHSGVSSKAGLGPNC